MASSNRFRRRAVSAAVAIVLLAAVAFILSGIWFKRDRPRLSDRLDQPARTSVTNSTAALAPTDWPQFRGPYGRCQSNDATIPFEWSDTKNVSWKTKLPGPGSSSPIVVGDRVFVTCYSDNGTDESSLSGLKRHLICINRIDGEILWTVDVPTILPEDPFRSYLNEHGYASHTPVSDGEAVYAFFGKSGVFAYDLEGRQRWHTDVGTQSDSKRWGSASSPVLYNDLVIVNASSESRAIWALDKKTGREIWKASANSLDLCFGTPMLVELSDGRMELALCVPGELWGLDPDEGSVNWYASVPLTGNVSPSVAVHDGIIYATGGYQRKGTVAVTAGGHGDVSDSHIRWSVRQSTYVPSPVWHDGHLYWIDDMGIAVCLNASTGEVVFRQRVALPDRGGRPVYASPVVAGDKLIVVTRNAGTVILAARPEYELIAMNALTDSSDFNATPAIASGQLFLRSNQAIYCIAAETKSSREKR